MARVCTPTRRFAIIAVLVATLVLLNAIMLWRVGHDLRGSGGADDNGAQIAGRVRWLVPSRRPRTRARTAVLTHGRLRFAAGARDGGGGADAGNGACRATQNATCVRSRRCAEIWGPGCIPRSTRVLI